MKTIWYSIFTIVTIRVIGCGNLTINTDNLPTLNVEAAIDNKFNFDLLDIVEEIDFISLGYVHRESLVGTIETLVESSDGFTLFDEAVFRNPVKFFNKKGEFISTMGTIGRGTNEYLSIRDIAVNNSTGETYVLTRDGSINAYNSDNRLFTRNDSVSDGHITYFKDQLILLKRPSKFTPYDSVNEITLLEIFSPDLYRRGHVNVSYKGNSIAGIYDGKARYTMLVGQYLSNNGNSLYVKEGRSDTVFCFKDGYVLEPAYKLEMGVYSAPQKMFESFIEEEQWERYYMVEKMFYGNKYIIVGINHGPFSSLVYLVFDKTDSQNRFMAASPDGVLGLFINGIAFTPCCVRDNRLIGYMQAIDIVDNADRITNPDLKAVAATLKEDSNPVIVIAKLKK